MANASPSPNTELVDVRYVDVGYDTILEAMVDMEDWTELFAKCLLDTGNVRPKDTIEHDIAGPSSPCWP